MAISIELNKKSKKVDSIANKDIIIQYIERILEDIEKAEQDLKAYEGESGILLMNYNNEIRLAKRELTGVRLTLTCLGYDLKGLPGDEED